jgi:hypothetical protein
LNKAANDALFAKVAGDQALAAKTKADTDFNNAKKAQDAALAAIPVNQTGADAAKA